MKVILKQDVEHVGRIGNIANVRPGYARNFLVPRGLAIVATKHNLHRFEHERQTQEARRQKKIREAEVLRAKLESMSCSISRKVGDMDKLFGSVTSLDIEKAFAAEGIKLDKKDILLEEPIKALGVYSVPVRVFETVTATTKVWVVKE